MKKFFGFYSLLVSLPILIILACSACSYQKDSKLAAPHYSIPQDNQTDDKLITAARQKAKDLGYNPIICYTDENGKERMAGQMTIRNNEFVIVEGDMVINLGNREFTAAGTILKKGEYCIFINGICEKASVSSLLGEEIDVESTPRL